VILADDTHCHNSLQCLAPTSCICICDGCRSKTVATRKRPVCQITLSNTARERLDEMATRCGETRSGMVEKLVRETEMPRPKTA
jgi:hypothetical protein